MDQKNTIVKCEAHPNCLFNYNGVCDNYIINIGADGKCDCYVETELVESTIQNPVKIGLALKEVLSNEKIQTYRRTYIWRRCPRNERGNQSNNQKGS